MHLSCTLLPPWLLGRVDSCFLIPAMLESGQAVDREPRRVDGEPPKIGQAGRMHTGQSCSDISSDISGPMH